MRALSVLSALLWVAACTTPNIRPDTAFDAASTSALVTIEISSKKQGTLNFDEQFPDGTIVGGLRTGKGFTIALKPKPEAEYTVLAKPGRYVLRSIFFPSAGGGGTDVCLSDGTFAFELTAGRSGHLGKFLQEGLTIYRVGPAMKEDLDAIAAKYPNVSATTEVIDIQRTTFPRGKDMFGSGDSCGGYYQKTTQPTDQQSSEPTN